MATPPGSLFPRAEKGVDLERRSRVVDGVDPSLVALLVTNAGVLVLALLQQWEIGTVIWIYWFQSVIIGFFQFFKILSLKHFSTEGIRVNDAPVEPTRMTQRRLALFFAGHYGFFHLAYLAFLWMEVPLGPESLNLVLSGAGLFFLNHAFSFIVNYRWDSERRQNLGRVIITPYARIVPMHIAIVFSFLFLSGFGLVLFMLLKTGADTAMHIAEHAGE